MPGTVCPVCDSPLVIPADVMENELIACIDCGSELEIICLDPLQLELAPEVPHQSRGPWFNEASTLVGNAIFEAVQGEKTAEQALKDAAEELRRTIDFG